MESLQEGDPLELGQYRILGRLGSGGMGQVYLGRDRTGRLAAVKVVHAGLADDPLFRSRFAREVVTARAIHAPWIAAVLEADTEAPYPWLATEYVPGLSLERAVAESGPLSFEAVRVLAARMADALAGLHAAEVVHRDVKPSNVMLAQDGPRLIDFGIATAIDGTRITHTGMMIGTPGYMSPEQARDEPVGAPSDVFSLASVLVYAASGHPPFGQTANPVAMLLRVANGEPDLSGVPDELRHAIGACLSKDPAARPTAAVFAAEIAPAPHMVAAWPPMVVANYVEEMERANAPTAATPTVLATRPWRATRAPARNLWPVLAAGVLIAIAAGAVVLWNSLSGQSLIPGAVAPAVFTSPAQISEAIDTEIHREQTVKASTTLDFPSQGAHDTDETQIRVDGAGTSVQQTGHIHSVYPATQSVLADFDTAVIVLPGHAWCMRDRLASHKAGVSFIEARPESKDPSDTEMLSCNSVVSNITKSLPSFKDILPAVSLVDSADDLLDGAPTRRYAIRFDQGALAQLEADPNWKPDGKMPPPDPATSTTETLWFDPQSHLLRTRIEKPGLSQNGAFIRETRYHDWGQPVQINPPPPEQIAPG